MISEYASFATFIIEIVDICYKKLYSLKVKRTKLDGAHYHGGPSSSVSLLTTLALEDK